MHLILTDRPLRAPLRGGADSCLVDLSSPQNRRLHRLLFLLDQDARTLRDSGRRR